MLTAIVDVGSNTIRLSIFRLSEEGGFRPLVSRKIVAGLVGYEEGGMLSAKGEAKLCKCLREFQHIIDALETDSVHAFATASLRRVSNSAEVIARVYEKTGIALELLSGEEEARLSYLGAQYSSPIENGIVIDIGGASVELAQVCKGKIGEVCSVPVGCLSLSIHASRFIVPQKREIKTMKATIKENLAAAKGLMKASAPTICFVGGTSRAAYRIAREMCSRDTRSLEPHEVSDIITGLSTWDTEVIQAVRFAAPERIFTLFAGLLIMQAVIQASEATTLLISKCGVREGYLIDNII